MRLWTTKRARHSVSTRFAVECCRERGRRLRHALGFRLRHWRHRHRRAKAVEPAAFQGERQELVTTWSADAVRLCVAEATVRRHPPLTAWGCLADDVPEVPRGDNHTQGYVDGAVAPLTGRPHDHLSPTLGIQGFARFLRRYARDHRWLVLQDRVAQPQGGPSPLSCGLRQGGFGSHPHPLRLRSGTRRSGVGFVNLA